MGAAILIDLPWPKAALSPNARVHYMAKHRATKAYRQACALEALSQGLRKLSRNKIEAIVTFYPPAGHRYDGDNLIARFKAGQDGLADVCGVDDSKWRVEYMMGDIERGGRVTVWIAPEDK
jgi:crossover junction endodeoxyribonuclease RusA